MIPHEIPDQPWIKIGVDLFNLKNKNYLLVVDYHSKFFEVCLLADTLSSTIVTHMKSIFARQGIPKIVVSDNGPQFSSYGFATFAKQWDFKHVTSSPTYPQSNGMAERTVQTVKNLIKKHCKMVKTHIWRSLIFAHLLQCMVVLHQLLSSCNGTQEPYYHLQSHTASKPLTILQHTTIKVQSPYQA